jgi:tRNA(Ile)-lysidine synthase TilS/MesJ
LIDHNIRSNSNHEAQKLKNFSKKVNINLKIFLNTKKIIKNIQAEARNARYDISFQVIVLKIELKFLTYCSSFRMIKLKHS